jgi:alpha-glucosidase (family GH31 glycosyl hydrolase)
VTEKGATTKAVHLPRGYWFDFWTEEKRTGGQEVTREMDLATLPLYVRAGSIIPLGPMKQHAGEHSDEPMTLVIYPGADASYTLYEDDGATFNYRHGEFTKIKATWTEASAKFQLSTLPGSTGRHKAGKFLLRLAGEKEEHLLEFNGHKLEVQLRKG